MESSVSFLLFECRKDVLWFLYNPPFDWNVKTKLGRRFLRIVDKERYVGEATRQLGDSAVYVDWDNFGKKPLIKLLSANSRKSW